MVSSGGEVGVQARMCKESVASLDGWMTDSASVGHQTETHILGTEAKDTQGTWIREGQLLHYWF
jgi:hypothetical protein